MIYYKLYNKKKYTDFLHTFIFFFRFQFKLTELMEIRSYQFRTLGTMDFYVLIYNWWWAWCWLWSGCCNECWCWCWCWWGCWCCSVGCLVLNLTLPVNELPLPWVPTTLGVSDSSSSSAPRLRNLTKPSSATSIVEPVVGVCSWTPLPLLCCTGVCLPRLSEFLRVCIPLPCRFNEPRPSCGKWPMVPDLRMECLSKVPTTTIHVIKHTIIEKGNNHLLLFFCFTMVRDISISFIQI